MTLLAYAGELLSGLVGRRGPGAGSRSADGRSYAFTSLTPITPGRDRGLVAHLKDLPMGRESPLARLPYVHFGRWLVIDQLKMDWSGAPRDPTELRSKYLLFSASITGADKGDDAEDLPGSFLRELAATIPEEADAIWGNCVGYPGSGSVDEFVAYLEKSQLGTLLFYLGYPKVTVEQVNRALAARDGLVSFVRRHQGEDDPAALQQAYIEESATWWP